MIPHLFRAHPIPKEVPAVIREHIQDFSESSKSDEEFIQKCFSLLISFQKGPRGQLFLHFKRLFWVDLDYLFNFRGYFHCTTINYLLRVMLTESGRFSPQHIQAKTTNVWFVMPHQYLRVKTKENIYI